MQTTSRGAHVQTRLRSKGGTFSQASKETKSLKIPTLSKLRRNQISKKKLPKKIERKKGKNGDPSQVLGLRKTSSATSCKNCLCSGSKNILRNGAIKLPRVNVRAETMTELILDRAGPVISKTSLLEATALRLIPIIVFVLQEEQKTENYWRQQLIPDGAYPSMKSVKF